jgi:hypothetical protein
MTDIPHGSPATGDPGERTWCRTCKVHRVQAPGDTCPVCLDTAKDLER